MASFFHKYQRPLMLGLAFFALLTFSVTGAMLTFFSRCSGEMESKLPLLTLPDGTRHRVTIQEWETAQAVYSLFVDRYPLLDLGFSRNREGGPTEEEKAHALDRVIILYCAAKAAGIGVTDAVIQDFIHSPIAKYIWRIEDQESYENIVHRYFHTSLPRFETAFRELKRIQFYIQTLAAGENVSVLSVLDKAREAGEIFKVEYAVWKEEDFEKELKKKKVPDKKLLAFLKDLPQGEKAPFLESKVVDLEVAWIGKDADARALKKVVAGRKPPKGSPGARFLEGLDKKLAGVTEAEISRYYDANKDKLYKLKGPASKPASQPASKPASRPAPRKYRPLDAGLKAKIRKTLELRKALEMVFAEATRQGRKEGRKFDLKAFLAKNFPFLKVFRTGLKAPKDLAKGPVLEGWGQTYAALAPAEGEFIPQVQSAGKALFFARVVQVKENVPRPLSEIRNDLSALFYKKESRKRAEKAAKDFLAGLREIGRKANSEGVAKIRKEIREAVEKRVAALKKNMKERIARDEKILAQKDLPQRAIATYREDLKKRKAELAALPKKREEIRKEEEKKREGELKKAELAKVGPSFRKYAQSRKLRVASAPPFPKNLAKIAPAALDACKDDALRFLEGQEGVTRLENLKKDQVSEVLEDPTSRTFLVVHMLDRHPKKVQDLTPGEVEDQLQKRKSDATHEFVKKALSFEALRRKFHYTNYKGEKEETKSGGSPASAPSR